MNMACVGGSNFKSTDLKYYNYIYFIEANLNECHLKALFD